MKACPVDIFDCSSLFLKGPSEHLFWVLKPRTRGEMDHENFPLPDNNNSCIVWL